MFLRERRIERSLHPRHLPNAGERRRENRPVIDSMTTMILRRSSSPASESPPLPLSCKRHTATSYSLMFRPVAHAGLQFSQDDQHGKEDGCVGIAKCQSGEKESSRTSNLTMSSSLSSLPSVFEYAAQRLCLDEFCRLQNER